MERSTAQSFIKCAAYCTVCAVMWRVVCCMCAVHATLHVGTVPARGIVVVRMLHIWHAAVGAGRLLGKAMMDRNTVPTEPLFPAP